MRTDFEDEYSEQDVGHQPPAAQGQSMGVEFDDDSLDSRGGPSAVSRLVTWAIGLVLVAVLVASLANGFAALFGDGDDGPEPVALPSIGAVTDAQRSAAADVPRYTGADIPGSWGPNVAQAYIESGEWLAYEAGVADPARQLQPSLAGVWVLEDATETTPALFVALTVRPHGYVGAGAAEVSWGSDLRTARAGLVAEAGLSDVDVAQAELVELGEHEALLVAGYATTGVDAGRNFAYVVLDDGFYFYSFRLSGDISQLREREQEFLAVVASARLDFVPLEPH